jgi:hypothetical protein
VYILPNTVVDQGRKMPYAALQVGNMPNIPHIEAFPPGWAALKHEGAAPAYFPVPLSQMSRHFLLAADATLAYRSMAK